MRTETEIADLMETCRQCPEWSSDDAGCRHMAACCRKAQTESAWRVGHCPKGKWPLPTVTAVCMTYGRYAKLCESVACFVAQDYPNKELVVVNTAEVPVVGDLPGVRFVNLPGLDDYERGGSLLAVRLRCLEEATGELFSWWDDDDIFLPWYLTERVAHSHGHNLSKPRNFWMTERLVGDCATATARLDANVMEQAVMIRRDWLDPKEFTNYGDRMECLPLTWMGNVHLWDSGGLTAVTYRWDSGTVHASTINPHDPLPERVAWNHKHSRDFGDGGPMVLPDVAHYWRKLADLIAQKHPDLAPAFRAKLSEYTELAA